VIAAAFKIVAIALSLALDVFAVSVGAGVRGVSPGMRLRIGAAFASAEVLMNCIGALLGAAVGHVVGGVAGYFGFAALIVLGAYMCVESLRGGKLRAPIDMSRGWGLALASLTISLDSLGVGFSILYIGVPPVFTLVAIAAVSVLSTTAGLMLGRRLGGRVEERAELLGGALLALTGIAFVLLKALGPS